MREWLKGGDGEDGLRIVAPFSCPSVLMKPEPKGLSRSRLHRYLVLRKNKKNPPPKKISRLKRRFITSSEPTPSAFLCLAAVAASWSHHRASSYFFGRQRRTCRPSLWRLRILNCASCRQSRTFRPSSGACGLLLFACRTPPQPYASGALRVRCRCPRRRSLILWCRRQRRANRNVLRVFF